MNLLDSLEIVRAFDFINNGHHSAGIRNERNILLAYLKKRRV